MTHPNSKIIYLKRTKPFIHESMGSEVMQEQLSHTKRSISSYFAGPNSAKIGTGLTPAEEKILIPALLGIEVNDKFYDRLTLFYTEIDTKVPHGAVGLQLEVGLELDNTKPVTHSEVKDGRTVLNTPLNIMDYIRYRHAIKFPYTALSPEAAEGNQLMWFFIEDPKLVTNSKMAEIEIRDEAMADYQQAKSDPKKVKMLVTVLRNYIRKKPGKPPVNVNNLGADELIITLRELATERPDKFHELANDADLKKRYFIDELLGVGLIQRQGNSIVDKDTNTNMGDTLKEVVVFLWNPKEAARLQRLKLEYDSVHTGEKMLS